MDAFIKGINYMGIVISAYAGVGKIYFCSINKKALDMVCMPYKYENLPEYYEYEKCKASQDNIMSIAWPYNYVDAIRDKLSQYEYVVIPSDRNVLSLLQMANIHYILCYPKRELRDEYEERFIKRGNTKNFLDIFIKGWDYFMDELEADTYGTKIILGSGEYLSDYISPRKL